MHLDIGIFQTPKIFSSLGHIDLHNFGTSLKIWFPGFEFDKKRCITHSITTFHNFVFATKWPEDHQYDVCHQMSGFPRLW